MLVYQRVLLFIQIDVAEGTHLDRWVRARFPNTVGADYNRAPGSLSATIVVEHSRYT